MKRRKETHRWKVNEVTDKMSGLTLGIYYDTEDKVFWSRIGPAGDVEDASQEGCEKKALKAAQAYGNEADWEQRLLVAVVKPGKAVHYGNVPGGGHRADPDNPTTFDSVRVGFTLARLWYRKSPDGREWTRDWDRTMPGDLEHPSADVTIGMRRRAQGEDIRRYHHPFPDRTHSNLPYTDDAWERLLEFGAVLARLQQRLDGIVSADDFADRLLAGKVGLLPADPVYEGDPPGLTRCACGKWLHMCDGLGGHCGG